MSTTIQPILFLLELFCSTSENALLKIHFPVCNVRRWRVSRFHSVAAKLSTIRSEIPSQHSLWLIGNSHPCPWRKRVLDPWRAADGPLLDPVAETVSIGFAI